MTAAVPRLLRCSILGLALLASSGCDQNTEAPGMTAAPPPPVTVSQPIVREVMEWHEYTGRTEAVKTVEVRARAKGYLHKVLFGDGSKINKGDLLFVIDPRPYQAELDKANADLIQARARLELAKDDLERAAKLLAAQAISEEEYDARSKGLQGMKGAVASAAASVEVARLNLEFTRIRAPISGRIGRTLITEGNLVNGNGTQDTLLTYIVSIDPIYVYLDADERSVLKYRQLGREGKRQSARDQNIPAELRLTDEDIPHQGYIDYVEPRADPATGTVRARGVFPNPDDQLSPGFFARVRVPGSGRYQAMLIAEHAIGIDQGQKFVMVVTDQNLAEYRPVRPGPIIDGLRVVSEGLQPGDWVIINGLQRVMPGKPVQATREPMPLPAAGSPKASATRPPPPRR